MPIQTRSIEFKFAELTDEGQFVGYGSTFGNVDSYDDTVAPGAFKRTLAEHRKAGTMPALLFGHDTNKPVGKWLSIEEDAHGLRVKGQIIRELSWGKDAYVMLKNEVVKGLSIGYQTVKSIKQNGLRVLQDVNLLEISIVAMPADASALVTGVKDLTKRNLEEQLREVLHFSQAHAKAIVAGGYPMLMRSREVTDMRTTAALKQGAAEIQNMFRNSHEPSSGTRC